MRDIHRSTTTWLARRTERGSAARPPHRSHRRRLTLEPLEGRALLSLTTWTVNSLGDAGAGSGNSGDLRYVITQADKTTGDNTINFSVTGTITLFSALPDLSNTTGLMDIDGPGASSLTVARSSASGTPNFSVFTVDSNVTASLTGLMISGGWGGYSAIYGGGISNFGTLTVTDSAIDNNSGGGIGGGIDNAGTLTVINSTIADNSGGYASASSGGGIYNSGTMTVTNSTIADNSTYVQHPNYGTGIGGGIDNVGTVTVTNSTIDNNSAGYGGGGIDNAGTLIVTNSTIAGNSASYGSGGGILSVGTVTVTNSTIADNSAGYTEGGGGGIYNSSGTVTVTDSTIADNSASIPYVQDFHGMPGGNGGGIYNTYDGTLKVTNSTIAGNSANNSYGYGGDGGGIYNIAGPATVITNSTIAGNSANNDNIYGFADAGGGLFDDGPSTILLDNTLIALNTSGTGTPDDIAGTVSSTSAYNLIGIGGSGGLVNGTNGNQVGVADPGLDPRGLQNNGGPTQTIALVTGSPAIDKGSNAPAVDPTTGKPLTTDQRGTGFSRIVNGGVDIGAYEVQSYITAVAVGWGTQTAALQTASDGLRLLPAGRNTDLPWLGIDRIPLTLTQAATLAAGDITAIGSSGVNYGPVTVSGSGTSYTITLAQPINAADRVTITIGNDLIAPFTRRLDVLPGDVNDDGVVNVQDMVAIRNQMLGFLGAVPTIFGDINGDGRVDILDYIAVRKLIGTTLPPIT